MAAFLPASLALRFLPKELQATGPSGTLWHGAIADLRSHGRAMGAVEWHVHPLSLLGGKLRASVRWVQQDIGVDADISASHDQFSARALRGGGSLKSLADLGIARGWNGKFALDLDRFALAGRKITEAAGTAHLDGLTSSEFPGADFGGITLTLAPDAVQDDGTAVAQVSDAGGMLQLAGSLTLTPAQNLATFSGSIKERVPLPGALQQRINELAQMRGRDAQGRIPVEFEFAL